jgi:peptide/nickel transport system permease protein
MSESLEGAARYADQSLSTLRDDKPRSQFMLAIRTIRRDVFAVAGFFLVILTILLAIFAPAVAPHDPYQTDSSIRLSPPGTSGHLLGTDQLGRDILSRLLWGGRVSLPIAFIPVVISSIIGIMLGLVAGYVAGRVDNVIMRVLDVVLAFPAILLAIALVSALGPSMFNVMFAITVVAIPVFARIARASTLSVRNIGYVEAAEASGASSSRIVLRHILPNIVGPILVYATLQTGAMIIFAAGLSFLGLGVQPPTADWGVMLSAGREVLGSAPHIATIPGLMIFFVTLSLNMFGDGLRDALDPHLRT